MVYFGGGGGASSGGNTDFTGTNSFLDGSKFSIKNQADNTKIIQFSAASITAGQTRTLTAPDASGTVALLSGPASQTFSITPTIFAVTANDGVQITSSTGNIRTNLYVHNTHSNSSNGVILDNDHGSLASYFAISQFGSTFPGTFFGTAVADRAAVIADGASSAGMLLGTLTNDTLVIGTNDTARVTLGGTGSLALERTVTAGGTTGDRTINKMSGTVNFAAGASSITVTNSLVDTSSIIFGTIRTADATATFIKSIVPGSGSFVITLNAAATAETSVGFLVTN